MLPGTRADAEERSRADRFLGGGGLFFSSHFDRDCVEFHLTRMPNKPLATGQLPDSSHRKKKQTLTTNKNRKPSTPKRRSLIGSVKVQVEKKQEGRN